MILCVIARETHNHFASIIIEMNKWMIETKRTCLPIILLWPEKCRDKWLLEADRMKTIARHSPTHSFTHTPSPIAIITQHIISFLPAFSSNVNRVLNYCARMWISSAHIEHPISKIGVAFWSMRFIWQCKWWKGTHNARINKK